MIIVATLWTFRYFHNLFSTVTIPDGTHYFNLLKTLIFRPVSEAKIIFAKTIVTLGIKSLDSGNGIGYLKIPLVGEIIVLSKPELIYKLYNDYESSFSQEPFFRRLAVVLGADNLMSSKLNSTTHTTLRHGILNRNEKFIACLPQLIHEFFHNHSTKNQAEPLTKVMEALSRAILLTVYFNKDIVPYFEKHYDTSLTNTLLDIIELEVLPTKKQETWLALRDKLFDFGHCLLLQPELRSMFSEKDKWLDLLLKVRVTQNKFLHNNMIKLLGFKKTQWCELNYDHWMQLLDYAKNWKDEKPLSSLIRDIVNESFFIPLLGFDATATMVSTLLRVIMQKPRIKTRILQEIDELKRPDAKRVSSSYINALIQEALRLFPPAPIVPEIVTQTFSMSIEGKNFTFYKNALIFIPLEVLHRHPKNYPAIPLLLEEQKEFDLECIDSQVFFPERHNPRKPNGDLYHSRSFPSYSPCSFFAFKAGKKKCPGLRLAMQEGETVVKMIEVMDIHLRGDKPISFISNYKKSLQSHETDAELVIELRRGIL